MTCPTVPTWAELHAAGHTAQSAAAIRGFKPYAAWSWAHRNDVRWAEAVMGRPRVHPRRPSCPEVEAPAVGVRLSASPAAIARALPSATRRLSPADQAFARALRTAQEPTP